jgi:hypothetical protein
MNADGWINDARPKIIASIWADVAEAYRSINERRTTAVFLCMGGDNLW